MVATIYDKMSAEDKKAWELVVWQIKHDLEYFLGSEEGVERATAGNMRSVLNELSRRLSWVQDHLKAYEELKKKYGLTNIENL